MLGNIYTDQSCPICNGKFVDMGPKYGFRCPAHKEIQAHRVRAKVGKLYKRFSGPGAYELAQQWLGGIRAKIGDPDSHGKFDKRDYDRSNPLAFVVLADNYLSKKEDKVSKSQFRSIRNTLKRATEAPTSRVLNMLK